MDFEDLVLQSESLVKNLDEDNIPHVHKNIDHLRQQKDKFICSRVAQNDIKAARLLGNRVGNELSSKLSKTLESLETYSVSEKVSVINTDDIPSFLKQQRENAILLAFQLAKDCSNKESFKEIAKAKKSWWNTEKNRICNVMLNADKLPNLIQSNQRSIKPAPIDSNNYVLHNFTREELEYLKNTSLYVDNIINEKLTHSIEKSLLQSMRDSKKSDLSEIYSLVCNYCNVSDAFAYKKTIENRQYDSEMCHELISSSITHLESEFLSYIKKFIMPSHEVKVEHALIRNHIGVFVKSLLLKDDFTEFEDGRIDGIPLWPLVYTSFRSGLYELTLNFLKEAGGHISDFKNIFAQYLQNGYLSYDLTKKMTNEYKRSVKSSGDVFKRLIFCLLSGCDVEDNHTSILTSIDDFMWAKLWYAKRVNSLQRSSANSNKLQAGDTLASESNFMNQLSTKTYSKSTDIGSLKHLQKLILEDYGESYFQANENPIAYARILMLCQLFENAVAFLARFEVTMCHGVHLGIVLWTKALLLVTNDIRNSILSRNEQETPSSSVSSNLLHVNLARLVSMYVSKFQHQYPSEAIDLFYLLRTMETPTIPIVNTTTASLSVITDDLFDACEQSNQHVESVFVRLVSELAVSSQSSSSSNQNMSDDCDDESYRMLQILFGKSGNGTGGLLQARGLDSEISSLLKGIASRLVALGKTEAASEALELSGQIPEAADLLSRCLATLSVGSCSPASTSVNPHIMKLQSRAYVLIHTYQSDFPDKIHLLQRVLAASLLLIGSHTDQHDPIRLLDQTELLPPSSDMVLSYAQQFTKCTPILKSLLAPLLLCAARVLRELASSHYSVSRDAMILNNIRIRAAALVVFAGQLPYRFPGEVYSCLSQLEIAVS